MVEKNWMDWISFFLNKGISLVIHLYKKLLFIYLDEQKLTRI